MMQLKDVKKYYEKGGDIVKILNSIRFIFWKSNFLSLLDPGINCDLINIAVVI